LNSSRQIGLKISDQKQENVTRKGWGVKKVSRINYLNGFYELLLKCSWKWLQVDQSGSDVISESGRKSLMPMTANAADAESQLESKSGKDQVVKIARSQFHQHIMVSFLYES
jgi:hypothetical protein